MTVKMVINIEKSDSSKISVFKIPTPQNLQWQLQNQQL